MIGSPSAIITIGLGDWGNPSLMLTVGYGQGESAKVWQLAPVGSTPDPVDAMIWELATV